MNQKGKKKTCSRGHIFYKTSTCPICPQCWPGYRLKLQKDFPEKLSAPALRALHNAKIFKLSDLTKKTKEQIADLHGMGPSGVRMLTAALKSKKLSFKTYTK